MTELEILTSRVVNLEAGATAFIDAYGRAGGPVAGTAKMWADSARKLACELADRMCVVEGLEVGVAMRGLYNRVTAAQGKVIVALDKLIPRQQ